MMSICFLVGAASAQHGITAKGDFTRRVEQYREQQKFREQLTEGGFYSEADMKKSKAEGGLGLSAQLGVIDAIIHAS